MVAVAVLAGTSSALAQALTLTGGVRTIKVVPGDTLTAFGARYSAGTHGCIRLHPDDIAWLYDRVGRGTPGRIVYAPVIFGVVNGVVYLEAHRDVYRRDFTTLDSLHEQARAGGFDASLDWTRVERVLSDREGIARPVDSSGNQRRGCQGIPVRRRGSHEGAKSHGAGCCRRLNLTSPKE